jgi:hypothetical protein
VGAEVEEDRLDLLFAQLEGKDITELLAMGREQLAYTSFGAAAAVAASRRQQPPPAPPGPRPRRRTMRRRTNRCCIRVLDILRASHADVSKVDLNIFDVASINFRCCRC